MSELKITGSYQTSLMPESGTRSAATGSSSGNIFGQKTATITISDKDEKEIIRLLKIIRPNIEWKSLSDADKYDWYLKYQDYMQNQHGVFQDEYQKEQDDFRNKAKNLNNSEDINYLMLETVLKRENPNLSSLSRAEKEKAVIDKKIEILQLLYPDTDFSSLDSGMIENMLLENGTTIEGIIYACFNGDISATNLKNTNFNESIVDDYEYNWMQWLKEAKKENKNLEMASTARDAQLFEQYYNYRQNVNAIAEYNTDMSDGILSAEALAKLREDNLENFDKTRFNILKGKIENGEPLTDQERAEYEVLKELSDKLGGDLTGVRTISAHARLDKCYLKTSKVFGDNEKINFEALTDDQIARLEAAFLRDYNACETEEAKIEFLNTVKENALSSYEAKLYDDFIFKNNIDVTKLECVLELSPETKDTTPTDETSGTSRGHRRHHHGVTGHNLAAHFSRFEGENETNFARLINRASTNPNGAITGHQFRAIATNNLPNLDTENVKPISLEYARNDLLTNDMGKILTEIKQKNPEVGTELYNDIATDEQISLENKAIIFRDAIDYTQDDEFKKFLENLANQNGIDYSNVPPHDTRTASTPSSNNSTTTTNSSGENVANTNYTANEISNILNRNNSLGNTLNGFMETLGITLGKTPDTNSLKEISSLNDAIKELKTGSKITDVFKNSPMSVKQELIKVICKYGKNSISKLINTFGGDTIYNLAKSENEKAIIKKEIERIALSDATQRTALAEINKKEEQKTKGFSLKG